MGGAAVSQSIMQGSVDIVEGWLQELLWTDPSYFIHINCNLKYIFWCDVNLHPENKNIFCA